MLMYLVVSCLCCGVSMIFFLADTVSRVPGYILLGLAICLIVSIFLFPNFILIDNDIITVENNPILTINKTLEGRKSLILWNNTIYIEEIENIEIVSLCKKDKKIS